MTAPKGSESFRFEVAFSFAGPHRDKVRAIAEIVRVKLGGHHVPAFDIRRRYMRSLRNPVRHYLPLADEWTIFDNSGREPRLVADGTGGHARVMDEPIYRQIRSASRRT